MKFAVLVENEFLENMTPKELWLYVNIKSRSTFGYFDTTIDSLGVFAPFKSRGNKHVVEEVLTSLVERGLVTIEQKGLFQRIHVHSNNNEYELIPMEIMEMCYDLPTPWDYFHIQSYIYRFQRANEYNGNGNYCYLSYSHASKILKCSRTKAMDILKDLEERGLLEIQVGKRLPNNRQEMNKYRLLYAPSEPRDYIHQSMQETPQEPLMEHTQHLQKEKKAHTTVSEPSEVPQPTTMTNNPKETLKAPETVSESPQELKTPKEYFLEHVDNAEEEEPKKEESKKNVLEHFWSQYEEDKKEDSPIEKKLTRPQKPDLDGLSPLLQKIEMRKYEKELAEYEKQVTTRENEVISLVF